MSLLCATVYSSRTKKAFSKSFVQVKLESEVFVQIKLKNGKFRPNRAGTQIDQRKQFQLCPGQKFETHTTDMEH